MSDAKDEDDEEYYEIEKILKKKVKENGEVTYLIKWFGYDKEHDTWEPASGLPTELVDEYETGLAQRSKQRKKKCEALKVIGLKPAKNENDEIAFLFAFSDETNRFFKRSEANKLYSELVIEFYDEQISYEGELTLEELTLESHPKADPPSVSKQLEMVEIPGGASTSAGQDKSTAEGGEKLKKSEETKATKVIGSIPKHRDEDAKFLVTLSNGACVLMERSDAVKLIPELIIKYYEDSMSFEDD